MLKSGYIESLHNGMTPCKFKSFSTITFKTELKVNQYRVRRSLISHDFQNIIWKICEEENVNNISLDDGIDVKLSISTSVCYVHNFFPDCQRVQSMSAVADTWNKCIVWAGSSVLYFAGSYIHSYKIVFKRFRVYYYCKFVLQTEPSFPATG